MRKIIFLDFQYQQFGSFDDDYANISSALRNDYLCKYYKISSIGLMKNASTLIQAIFTRKDKVVFLSCKTTLMLLMPFIFPFSRRYYIYHFMPSHRRIIHSKLLPLLSKLFNIGVYSPDLQSQLKDQLGLNVTYIPARFIDRRISLHLLQKKMENPQITIFFPGIKKGVRRMVDIDHYIKELERILKKQISKIFIQSELLVVDDSRIVHIKKVDSSMYRSIFDQSLFVIFEFYESYELRASAVVMDALKSGSIILSKDNCILPQYGYPNSIVTNLEILPAIIKRLSDNLYKEESFVPFQNEKEHGVLWLSFLN